MPNVLSLPSQRVSVSGSGLASRHNDRVVLGLCTVVALAAAGFSGAGSVQATVEPDLARLLRYMALLKGVFAVIALGACYWRLARPAASWRRLVYLVGPGLMAGGALCLWRLQSVGLATIGLHAGMFALLAAALTDAAFIPARRPRHS